MSSHCGIINGEPQTHTQRHTQADADTGGGVTLPLRPVGEALHRYLSTNPPWAGSGALSGEEVGSFVPLSCCSPIPSCTSTQSLILNSSETTSASARPPPSVRPEKVHLSRCFDSTSPRPFLSSFYTFPLFNSRVYSYIMSAQDKWTIHVLHFSVLD